MAKRKNSLIPSQYKQKLLTAAGIFAAGSVVGSALEIPPMSAYFEILTPEPTEIRETEAPSSGSPETFQSLSAETDAAFVPQETAPAPAEPVPSVPADPVPAPEPSQPPSETPAPEPLPSSPAPDPEPLPEPAQGSDWMEGIFVPADPVPGVPDTGENGWEDWMESLWPHTESAPVPAPPSASSMTEELAALLENIAVFWSNSDNKIHLDPACTSADAVFAGTVEEAQTVRTDGWCRRCAEHLDGTDNTAFYIKGNAYASADVIAAAYTYADYQNRIPSDAFGG